MSVLNFVLGLVILYLLWNLTIRLGLNRLNCWRTFSRESFLRARPENWRRWCATIPLS